MTYLNALAQPVLEIPPSINAAAWQNRSRTAPARWNTYLNQVCSQTVSDWLQDARETLDRTALQNLWQLVNGTSFRLDAHRIIVIPDKTMDTREFRVPQEWVDIPSWVGDYYFAAQVDPDEATILIWGYTTHAQLKALGEYDASDRMYSLDAEQMSQDFAVFALTRELYPQAVTRAEIAALAPVPAIQAENLVQRLANPEILQPRLEIPFQLWGALLEQSEWQQRLGQLRQGVRSVSLRQWLQNTIAEGWQTLDSLLGDEPALAYRFRQTADATRPTVQCVKILELREHTFWLSVVIEQEEDDRLSVRVQLRGAERDEILPSGVMLTMLSSAGEVVQSVEARDQDNLIQLRRFRCSAGTEFSLQISFDRIQVTEDFIA
ncbi:MULTISPECIES: DUF1822 family protein [Leptolyngbya]|uniref:DUF1822 family protein n=1 Tax=Leptolyngbya TaxID=47251 RepID=UPI001684731B|nr:DUF1822 family protein [Leptolyngbya sp. FACHB-1624]MBD1856350.1 DUF1822 family protein [Leptolyngbya sp. FACHB-1624]